MKIFHRVSELQTFRRQMPSGTSLGFVPTMGALHEGHGTLVRDSCTQNEKTWASIFINPTQFNSAEDLKHYPRTLEKDLALLKEWGCDAVFLPTPEEIYPEGIGRFSVHENSLSRELCGAHRSGHFEGMLTVVLKLLLLAKPTRAYFGEKDYQQYLLVRDLAQSFFLETQIVAVPTVRESDDLAMSSRNVRLSASERAKAALFPKILRQSVDASSARTLLENEGFRVDYVSDFAGRRLSAVHLGSVRLIDNWDLGPIVAKESAK